MYAIITITIIVISCDFNASYNTLKIAILNTLKTEIFNSATLVTHKSRDTLFVKNKAISLLNT